MSSRLPLFFQSECKYANSHFLFTSFSDGTGSQYEEDQAQIALNDVMEFRYHPAVLMWGVGNEVELWTEFEDHPRIYKSIDDLAARIKALDPYHPT